jgi:hypothetical protein
MEYLTAIISHSQIEGWLAEKKVAKNQQILGQPATCQAW